MFKVVRLLAGKAKFKVFLYKRKRFTGTRRRPINNEILHTTFSVDEDRKKQNKTIIKLSTNQR